MQEGGDTGRGDEVGRRLVGLALVLFVLVGNGGGGRREEEDLLVVGVVGSVVASGGTGGACSL